MKETSATAKTLQDGKRHVYLVETVQLLLGDV
jgi:hypothetical protein